MNSFVYEKLIEDTKREIFNLSMGLLFLENELYNIINDLENSRLSQLYNDKNFSEDYINRIDVLMEFLYHDGIKSSSEYLYNFDDNGLYNSYDLLTIIDENIFNRELVIKKNILSAEINRMEDKILVLSKRLEVIDSFAFLDNDILKLTL